MGGQENQNNFNRVIHSDVVVPSDLSTVINQLAVFVLGCVSRVPNKWFKCQNFNRRN